MVSIHWSKNQFKSTCVYCIIEFLKSAKSCIDTIISELEELKELEEHKMKKINLFIEIIKELGLSIVNLENAYEDTIPLEHKLKYLIIKELKFDLEDFTDSLREYRVWYKAIKIVSDSSKFAKCKWFCCGSYGINSLDVIDPTNPANSADPTKLIEMINLDISGINIIDASIQLANILPSTMNKRIDESFHKIMAKLMIVIELEKDIFGTAINITHPVLRRAWMNLGPSDKMQNEVEQYKLEEALLAMLKDDNHGIIVNEKKCRELINDFLEELEKKAGNKPNGRISIDELNEYVTTDNNVKNVLGLLGLKTQPGCNLCELDDLFISVDDSSDSTDSSNSSNSSNSTRSSDESANKINMSTNKILKVLANYVLKHINSKDLVSGPESINSKQLTSELVSRSSILSTPESINSKQLEPELVSRPSISSTPEPIFDETIEEQKEVKSSENQMHQQAENISIEDIQLVCNELNETIDTTDTTPTDSTQTEPQQQSLFIDTNNKLSEGKTLVRTQSKNSKKSLVSRTKRLSSLENKNLENLKSTCTLVRLVKLTNLI